jgi:hypothetical protein
MLLAHLSQVTLQFFNCRVAFLLVACRNDEDEGLGLRTRLEKFVDQACTDTQSQAADQLLVACTRNELMESIPVCACNEDIESILGLRHVCCR